MRRLIHDRNDNQTTPIGRNGDDALRPNGTGLEVECVMTPGNDPAFAKLSGFTTMVLLGGKVHAAHAEQGLLESAGFPLIRGRPTATDVSIRERCKGSEQFRGARDGETVAKRQVFLPFDSNRICNAYCR